MLVVGCGSNSSSVGVVEGNHYAQERQVVDNKMKIGVEVQHVFIKRVQGYNSLFNFFMGQCLNWA